MAESEVKTKVPQWAIKLKNFFAVFVASGFGSGFIPLAPGTWGSLVGVGFLWWMGEMPAVVLLGLCILIGALGVWVSGVTCQVFKKPDCQYIVIDEIVGVMLTMVGIPNTPYWLVVGFVAFRVFDVVKPPPANILDRKLKNGLGVMLDDVVAGIYGNILLHLMIRAQL